jgi:hypothetical protein
MPEFEYAPTSTPPKSKSRRPSMGKSKVEFDEFFMFQEIMSKTAAKLDREEKILALTHKLYYKGVQPAFVKWKLFKKQAVAHNDPLYFKKLLKSLESIQLMFINSQIHLLRRKDRAFKKWQFQARLKFPCYRKYSVGETFSKILKKENETIWRRKWHPHVVISCQLKKIESRGPAD